jgi:hypothetical protein
MAGAYPKVSAWGDDAPVDELKESIIEAQVLTMAATDAAAAAVSRHEVQAELQRVLCSARFCKATRARPLLTYLVERYHEGAMRELQEYAIGLAVFRRDPATYCTSDDPIVRVQVRRLRQQLDDYYVAEGRDNGVRISIPCGTYVPLAARSEPMSRRRIAFVALVYHGDDAAVASFSLGVNEEMQYRLHRTLGAGLVRGGGRIGQQLEGSLRADGETLRVTLRLLDLSNDSLLWSSQVDNPHNLSISHQARLALACCRALDGYLRQSRDIMVS